ncbi:MAG: cytochrome c biogenesis protein CcsA [Pseudoflavonifractor sp.]|nr:cytochrome c biogenesis protein CcsA [Pseudoflavonifractor sp.]
MRRSESRFGMWRLGSMLLHASLLLIALGGVLTWLTGSRGSVTLLPGESRSSMVTMSGGHVSLPMSVTLDSFVIDRYPGGVAPRDYTSWLRVGDRSVRVSMNHIARIDGYRFYQSGYTPVGAAVIGVAHDPWGISLAYAGFAMFCLAALMLLLSPDGRFRRLLRALSVVAALIGGCHDASCREVPVLPRASADSLARRQVIYNGRVVPFGTLARDFVVKLTGTHSYGSFTPEQIVRGWYVEPDGWSDVPLIEVKSRTLRDRLGVTGRRVSFSALFDSRGYRLQRLFESGDADMREAITAVDDKVGIIMSLVEGRLIVPVPDGVERLPEWRVSLELCYNDVAGSSLPFIICLSFGILGIVVSLLRDGRVRRWLSIAVRVVVNTMMIWEILLFVARWIVAGHVPLGNGYETLLFMAVGILLLSLWAVRRVEVAGSIGLLLAGFVLLVARLSGLDPQVSPLMPVLASPWLAVHVSVIMASYALLAFTFAAALAGLSLPARQRQMALLSRVLLYPGVLLLGVGIILGSVWANISWGRYWDWDPKETWALVTFILYSVPFHSRFIRSLRRPRSLLVYLVVAFAAVVMTYFGVNMLGGLHAYA